MERKTREKEVEIEAEREEKHINESTENSQRGETHSEPERGQDLATEKAGGS